MSDSKIVTEHYEHGDLLTAIGAAVTKLGKSNDSVTIEELAVIDEFHIGGRLATEHLLSQLDFTEQDHILDVGCGLGGASRFVAHKYVAHVTGIDLTQEYVDTGTALCTWVNLDKKVTLHHGSALSMPFGNEIFDGAYMLHVSMNIEDKTQLFTEVCRVLRPGAFFGIYDIMRDQAGELTYPVPWATDSSMSKLATSNQYSQALSNAGFEVSQENNRREFALDFFEKLRARTKASGGPPPVGIHTLIKASASVKINNMIAGIAAGHITPVEIIAQKN